MSNIVESVEGAIKDAEVAVANEAHNIEGEAVKIEHAVVSEGEKACKFVCVECEKMDAAAKAEAAKVAADAEAEAKKLNDGLHAAIKDVEDKLTSFIAAVKDDAAKSSAINELETVVDRLKRPVSIVVEVDTAAAMAAKAAHDAVVAAAKELKAQAQEDAHVASGWIARTWHKVWAWL